MPKIKNLSELVFRPMELTFSQKVALHRQKNKINVTQAILHLSDDYSLSVLKYEEFGEYCFGIFDTRKNKPAMFSELKKYCPLVDHCFYGNKEYTEKVIYEIQELVYNGKKAS